MTAINSVTDLSINGEVALVTINSPPVNALSQPVRDGLKRGVEAAEANSAVKAIVIICDGRTFIAGADISEFGKPFAPPPLPEALDAMENASKPVIAALHGTALGGGFEVALTAHYRIAVPSAKCGLPEIKLGIIPGAGGTQRLPRLIGPEKALDVILSGVPFGAREAKEWGVVDELAEEGKLRESAIAFARRLIAEKAPLKKVRDRSDKLEPARGRPEIFEAIRKANARKFRGFEAWEKAIELVKNAVDLPFDEGMAKERALFAALVVTTQSKAQRYVFFAERQAAKVADIPADTPTRKIAKVGVIGAGTMGGGIAMNFLTAGIPVTIVETSKEALDRGVSIMRRNYENTAKKGRMTMAEVEERMGRLSPTLDFNALADADLVIEAVFEDMDLKKSVFERLELDRQARRDPRIEHLLPRRRRHRGEDQAAGGCDRHAFLLTCQRDAPARNCARRKDVKVRARDHHSARAEDRQGPGRRRRRSRLRRQPHAGPAPASRRRSSFSKARRLRTSTVCSSTSACRWAPSR